MEYLSPPLSVAPSAVLLEFNEYMEGAIEGWTPIEANLDSRIGGAVSQIAAQLHENAADGATNIFRYFGAKIVGVEPGEASYATGTATWTAVDTAGYTIPAGTVAVFKDGLGNHWGFEVVNGAVIAPGKTEVTGVAMQAVNLGPESNGILGEAVELSVPLSFVAKAVMTTTTNGGTEEEEDAAYLTKLSEEFQTLSPKPILPKDFNILLARQSASVGRSFTLGTFNPAATTTATGTLTSASPKVTGLTTGTTNLLVVGTEVSGTGVPVGARIIAVGATEVTLSANATESKANTLTFTGLKAQQGFVTSWAASPSGTEIAAGTLTEIEAAIQAMCMVGVEFRLKSPTYTAINVEATIFAWPGQSKSIIEAGTKAAVEAFLSPATWGAPPTAQTKEFNNEPKVRLAALQAALLRVVGVHFVEKVKINTVEADLLMTGFVPLPTVGTITTTVNIG